MPRPRPLLAALCPLVVGLLGMARSAHAQPTDPDAGASDGNGPAAATREGSDASDARPAERDPADGGAPAETSAEAKPKKVPIEVLPIVDAEPPASSFPDKRPVPDYDGRGEDPTTAKDVLLWIPRVLLAPLYLASEYLVRRPIGAIIIAVERDKLAQRALHVVTLGTAEGPKTFGLVPTFYFDSNQLPSVGVYLWWDDVGSRKNHLRFHFATWGPQWLNTQLTDRYDLGAHSTVSLRAAFSRRRDLLFYGFGPDSRKVDESRYEAITFDGGPGYNLRVVDGVELASNAGFRNVWFNEGACCSGATVHQRVREGRFAAPPRLGDGYSAIYDALTVTADSRDRHPRTQSGVRVAVSGQPQTDE